MLSGGSLNYFYCQLQEHEGDFGDKELDELVKDLAELFHEREWFLSGDTGEGSWNEERDAFKAKWFTKEGRADRIDKYLSETVEEIRKSLGISDMYCKNCSHWYLDRPDDDKYGRCEYMDYCLMHRCESCNRWESNEGKNETC